MKSLDYREYYHRNLPHIQPRGATFLVNFRLVGSLPIEVVERLRDEAELERMIKYVLYNPVKANLVKDQKVWKWTYCKYDF